MADDLHLQTVGKYANVRTMTADQLVLGLETWVNWEMYNIIPGFKLRVQACIG